MRTLIISLIAALTALVIFWLPTPNPRSAWYTKSLTKGNYLYDSRTELCYYATTAINITNVPCTEKVMALAISVYD